MGWFGLVQAMAFAGMAVYFGHNAYQSYSGQNYRRRILENVESTANEQELREHTKHFERTVIKVTDNIYQAIGYSLGNSIMVVAPEGLIIVDVTETVESAQLVYQEFRKISTKPVKAIIYTHQHPDHTWGAKAFIEDPNNPPEIWAHQSTARAMNLFLTTGSGARIKRSYRMFGSALSDVINDGIGPFIKLKVDEGHTMGLVYPNRVLRKKSESHSIAGLDVVLYHIPGETDDQIGLWVPRDRAFMCGDDLYKAFPNIYTIRGATARDAVDWYNSLDTMIDLEPEHLVPSHSQPVSGREKVRDLLIAYRDGIQYVHDQTVRHMNKGLKPDDIADIVRLPDHLRLHPYLREYYGTVHWSVKGIFAKYLGWFSGDPVDLFSLNSRDRAELTVELAGGVAKTVDAARKAFKERNYQWALELATHALRVDARNEQAKNIRVEALVSLAAGQLSPNARNYYMTCALEETEDAKPVASKELEANIIDFLPVGELFVIMQLQFKPETCGDRKTIAVFEFTDTKEVLTVQLRNGVAIVKARDSKSPDLKVTTTTAFWKHLVKERFTSSETLKNGQLNIQGGVSSFKSFLACFEA